MSRFYMMIGIPGSGKTYCANKMLADGDVDIVLSSDEYRSRLFGNEYKPENNYEVFNQMNNDTINNLICGRNVCYDATNIKTKDRKRILSKVNKLKNIEKIAVYFKSDEYSFERCVINNENRSNVVPKDVLTKMYYNMQQPCFEEGFDCVCVRMVYSDL